MKNKNLDNQRTATAESKHTIAESGTATAESKHTKKLREEYIHFTDDFVFTKVMSDVDLFKEFIETILDMKIPRIIKHEAQKCLTGEYDTKSMRIDVYTETFITMVNTEMQKYKEDYIGKRSRYSGSLMDQNQLARGGDYKSLKVRYVIFICTNDPFGKGLCQYTFHSKCDEDNDVDLSNGITDIVINLKGDLTSTREEYKELIEYMAERKCPQDCTTPLVQKIHTQVERCNQNAEFRRLRMTMEDRIREREENSRETGIEVGREAGIEIGEARGEARGIYALMNTLNSMGISLEDALQKAAEQFDKTISEIQKIMAEEINNI